MSDASITQTRRQVNLEYISNAPLPETPVKFNELIPIFRALYAYGLTDEDFFVAQRAKRFEICVFV